MCVPFIKACHATTLTTATIYAYSCAKKMLLDIQLLKHISLIHLLFFTNIQHVVKPLGETVFFKNELVTTFFALEYTFCVSVLTVGWFVLMPMKMLLVQTFKSVLGYAAYC